MTDKYWDTEFKRRSDQLALMLHEIGLLLEDSEMIYLIGDKTYMEFDRDVLMPATRMFYPNEPKEVWKYRGHRVSLIRYYCDRFNFKEPEPVKHSLADLHQHE